jgi:SlyX protein
MSSLQEQLIELETKLAYQEDTIQALNNVLIKQQDQIDRLEQICQLFSKQIKEIGEQDLGDGANVEPPPPHY